MDMLYENLLKRQQLLDDNDVKLRIIGEMDKLPGALRKKLRESEEKSQGHRGLQVNLALNYGSRQEILHAVREIISRGIPAERIDEAAFSGFLYTAGSPDPDLLIRTSGELRLSNFLLYQLAYAELYFTPTLWPDFRARDFFQAVIAYQARERRFGNL